MAGLYIHIPFCRSKCVYCDFYSVARRDAMTAVAEGIVREIECRLGELSQPLTTVYIGGGTPSVMPPELLAEIVKAVPPVRIEEFTVEANPDDISADYVRSLAAMGVNRLSMGVQSLDNAVLRSIGRRHSSAGALAAIETALHSGISNISADLIYGLPGQTAEGWEHDVTVLLESGISHLSAYCLTYHERTPLYRMMQAGRVVPTPDDELATRFAALRRHVAAAGWEHYEISNMAKPGYRSRHNSTYWEFSGQWLGVGPAAHSFDGHTRRFNPADIGAWQASLPNPAIIEEETDLDRLNDHIVSALRTSTGLCLADLPTDVRAGVEHDASRFVARGDMLLRSGHLSINPDRWLIADSFIREMIR